MERGMSIYWIWDKEKEEWYHIRFTDFYDAEEEVMKIGGYEKYDIFEKLS